jgi:hypothetical protein
LYAVLQTLPPQAKDACPDDEKIELHKICIIIFAVI